MYVLGGRRLDVVGVVVFVVGVVLVVDMQLVSTDVAVGVEMLLVSTGGRALCTLEAWT